MKISFNIPDNKVQRDIDSICEVFGYDGQDKQLFVEEKLKEYFQSLSRQRRLEVAKGLITVDE